ncbi:hypothetical protein, partial [Fictibacillus sp. 5RED26]|uniref:hypothetical protein n=1 Tax=Fictibacillus sp. 5RED26 TaxID=2745876 RepID=UPI001E4B0204
KKIEKKKGGLASAKLLIMGAGDGRLGGIALGSGRERLSRISERPLFLFLDLIEVRSDLIRSHFDLIFLI